MSALSTLADGMIGGAFGGGATLLAAWLTLRGERKRGRKERTYVAAAGLLGRIVDVEQHIDQIAMRSLHKDEGVVSMVLGTLQRGERVEVPVVGDVLIAEHYRKYLRRLMYFVHANLSHDEMLRAREDMLTYGRYIRYCLVRFMDGKKLPKDVMVFDVASWHQGTSGWQPVPEPEGWDLFR